VTITDQFGVVIFDVTKPTRLCNPANKNGEDPSASGHAGHLVCYAVRPARISPSQPKFLKRVVSTANQFGAEVLQVRRAAELCVPSLKDPQSAPTGVTPTPTPNAGATPVGTPIALHISPPSRTVNVSGSANYTATADFVNGTIKNYTQKVDWSSSDEGIATITNTEGLRGAATGIAPGSVTISAVDPQTGLAASPPAVFNVLGMLESITLSPTSASRAVGQAQNFTATGHYAGGGTLNITQQVTSSSSDPNVAVATNLDGNKSRVEAIGAGTATISATDTATAITSSPSGDATITVLGPLESIVLTPTSVTRAIGEAQNFTAIGHYVGGGTQNITQEVTYSSSDPNVAVATNLDGNKSRVDAVATGTATITATDPTSNITSNTATLTVIGMLDSIALTPVSATHVVGESEFYTAIGHYSDGSTMNLTQHVDYQSDDSTIAVAANTPGIKSKVDAVGPGVATISAKDSTTGVTSNSATLTVLGPLESITLAPLTATRAVGEVQHYTATGHYTGGATKNLTQSVDYDSSDPTVALAANPAGDKSRINAVGPGTATISATEPTSGISTTDSGDDVTITDVDSSVPTPSATPTPADATPTPTVTSTPIPAATATP
jgi:trimeric autotransporter adhesin